MDVIVGKNYQVSQGIINRETLRTSAKEYYPVIKINELDGFPGDLEEFLLSIVKWEKQNQRSIYKMSRVFLKN